MSGVYQRSSLGGGEQVSKAFPSPFFGACGPGKPLITMLLENGSLLKFSRNAEKYPSGKEEEVVVEEAESPKALAIACVPGWGSR